MQRFPNCEELAYRFGGPKTARYWEPEGAWYWIYEALEFGGLMPISGGVILTFMKAGAYRQSIPAPGLPSWKELEDGVAQQQADAQYAVGMIHKNRNGIASDWLRAIYWLRLAADQGHIAAQYELGRASFTGSGTPANMDDAEYWMKLAADQGHIGALRFLVSRTNVSEHYLNMWRLAPDKGNNWI